MLQIEVIGDDQVKIEKPKVEQKKRGRKKKNEAIKELEAIKKNIDTSIEEIEYALAKPEYAGNYLNNALRFLKERD